MSERVSLLGVSVVENEDKKTETWNFYKIIRNFCSACEQKNVKNIKKLAHNHNLFKNTDLSQSLDNNPFGSPSSSREFKTRLMNSLLQHFCASCQDGGIDMLFLVSAIFDPVKLQHLIKSGSVNVNQLRYTDSCLIFALKYGDVCKSTFVECVKILSDGGVNTNHHDCKGKTAMDYIAVLHEDHKGDKETVATLAQLASSFVEKGICLVDNDRTKKFLGETLKIVFSEYRFLEMEAGAKLFYWITKHKIAEFLGFKNLEGFANADDSENTLLQFASKQSDKLHQVVQFLLKKGADPNKATRCNTRTPLELAALANNQKIFEEILKHKETKISNKTFNRFVQQRPGQVRSKFFETFLESEKLNPSFKYEQTGNTPLHYAIRFCHKRAIQVLLKRKPTLDTTNKLGKCALDMIDITDLESYLNSCLALDNYAEHFTDLTYKMELRFNCLIDEKRSETRILCKIANRSNLEHLLGHPLVHAFISLKWHKVKWFFWWILFMQAVLFLPLSVLFWFYDDCIAAFVVGLINIVLKHAIFFRWWRLSKRKIQSLVQMPFHLYVEFLLTLTLMTSWFQSEFRAFALVEMSICFLLTAGYHPKLSKWSVMLQKVFKTFTLLLIFFSLIVMSFAMGFHILFSRDPRAYFSNFYSSIFITYIMSTGNLNIDKVDLDPPFFCRYFLFLLFAMGMCMVIINFWTGVAVSNIESIEKHSEIGSFRNVIIFFSFVDNYIYSIRVLQKLCCGVSPLLFTGKKNYEVGFFVNKKDQFEGQNCFPKKIDSDCFKKIASYYERTKKGIEERSLLTRLDQIEKSLNGLKYDRKFDQLEKILKEMKSNVDKK